MCFFFFSFPSYFYKSLVLMSGLVFHFFSSTVAFPLPLVCLSLGGPDENQGCFEYTAVAG